MNKAHKIFLFFAVAALFAGCFKKASNKTDYLIKPRVQQTQGDVVAYLPEMQCYAFDADTALWTVASYEDALNGTITSRTSSEKLSNPYATGEPMPTDSIGIVLKMSLEGPRFLIVAVDTQDSLYAYTQQPLASGLPELYVSLTFHPFHEGKSYKESGWTFCNDAYVDPTALTCYVEPQIQSEEDGELHAPEGKISVFAFLADTTSWRVASYEDAQGHILTSKLDSLQQRTQYDFTGVAQTSDPELAGLYALNLSSSDVQVTLMLVAVDPADGLYAYSQQQVDMKGESVTFPSVVFRTWQSGVRVTDDGSGWYVIDERIPAEPPANEEKR